jgi:hypothetical protein
MNTSIPTRKYTTDLTYEELSALVSAAKLKQGAKYRFPFQTRHLIPNTAVYNVGPVEYLIAEAATTSQLYYKVISESYPRDDIRYSLTDLMSHNNDSGGVGAGTKGCIYFRHDTIQDIYAGEDWRATKYRWWESSPGSGIFNVRTDNGGAYVDRYTFNNSATADYCRIIHIAPFAELNYSDPENLIKYFCLGNNIFAGGVTRVEALQGFQDNYYGAGASDLRFGWGANAHVVGENANSNIIGDCCANIRAGNNWQECIMISENSDTYIGDDVGFVTWTEGTESTYVPSGTQRCTIDLPGKFPYTGNPADNIVVGQVNQTDKVATLAGSTFSTEAINIVAGNIDLENYMWAGIINVASGGLNSISGMPDFDIEIHPVAPLVVSPVEMSAVSANGQIVDDIHAGAAWAYSANSADYFSVRKQTITNGNGTFTIARVILAVGGVAD